MKAKQKAAKPRNARKGRTTKRPAGIKPLAGGSWRMSDLALDLQVELRDRIEQAKRGEDLQDFDEAIADAERMSDEMLAILSHDPRRPAK